jgi:hypothetical protein
MRAVLLMDERHVIADAVFVEIRVWRVPRRVPASAHDLKYSLALVVAGECVLRYDNEAGKGDHRHAAAGEAPYRFTTAEQLLDDFWKDVRAWRPE